MLSLLFGAAVVAGLTGAWSPCGFSMVETLAPRGYAGRRRVTVAACATFAAGAVVGGLVTFGGLAWLGSALGAGGAVAVAVAAAVALVAAAGEARGARIVPQVRRQVPESWRRVLPVPLAAAGYGVLLGLGFTTFILTFAVWALAALCIALGDPAIGVAVGLGFGVGRALPVIGLAPFADSERGSRVHAAMAERPAILRALRAADAVALAALAVVLAAGPAQAAPATVFAPQATDPSADGDLLAYHRPGATGMLMRGAAPAQPLPGRFPATGGGHVAWIQDDRIVVARAADLAPVASLPAPGADAVAVSTDRVAWRAGDRIRVSRIDTPAAQEVARGDVGRPALEGARLVFHRATRTRSLLESVDLTDGTRSTLRSERGALLLNPTTLGDALLFVRSSAARQQVRLLQGTQERILHSTTPTARRDAGKEPGQGRHRHRGRIPPLAQRPRAGETVTLWTTALTPQAAYVTRLQANRGGGSTASLLRIAR